MAHDVPATRIPALVIALAASSLTLAVGVTSAALLGYLTPPHAATEVAQPEPAQSEAAVSPSPGQLPGPAVTPHVVFVPVTPEASSVSVEAQAELPSDAVLASAQERRRFGDDDDEGEEHEHED